MSVNIYRWVGRWDVISIEVIMDVFMDIFVKSVVFCVLEVFLFGVFLEREVVIVEGDVEDV